MTNLALVEGAVHLSAGRDVVLVAAGAVASLVNGVAGGGTLISFPVLLALGYPALTANLTNTVGIWPGYLSGAAGFRTEIGDQRGQLRRLALPALAGGAVGAVLLLTTPQNAFRQLAPWLVLFAAALFAAQPPLARALAQPRFGQRRRGLLVAGTALTAVYGGYFGAGMGVMLLAVLGLTIPDTLPRTSGLRTALSIAVNGVAAVIFVVAGHPAWSAVGLLALGSLAGGFVGARVALKLPAPVLRLAVVATGVTTTVVLLVRHG